MSEQVYALSLLKINIFKKNLKIARSKETKYKNSLAHLVLFSTTPYLSTHIFVYKKK